MTAAAAPRVRARGVAVTLGGADVVDGVDLDVVPGGWLAVVGPNGAGKSTLLRAVAGLVPHRGEVLIDGTPVRNLSARQRGRLIAYAAQTPAMPAGMSVGDYVLLGRTPYVGYFGRESGRDRVVVNAVLARLELERLRHRPLTSLSGGERQRAVLARAMAQQAPVLLLDEPTSALDIGHQQQTLELVDTLRRDAGLTVVMSIHDLTLAGQYADRLLLLSAGRTVATGAPAEVLTDRILRDCFGAAVVVRDAGDGRVLVHPVRPHADGDRAGQAATW